jgi:hypothetical protein
MRTFKIPEAGRFPPDISFGAYDELGRKIFYQPSGENPLSEDDIRNSSYSALLPPRLPVALRLEKNLPYLFLSLESVILTNGRLSPYYKVSSTFSIFKIL